MYTFAVFPHTPRVTFFCGGQCSVTCGEGKQTRAVTCVGSRGERLPNRACVGLAKPPSVQACRRPACYTHVTWHVTDYGLVGEIEENTIGVGALGRTKASFLFPLLRSVCAVHQELRWWCEREASELFGYGFELLPGGPVWNSYQTSRCGNMQRKAVSQSSKSAPI